MNGDPTSIDGSTGDWQERLALVVQAMREISRQQDPQDMVHAYSARMQTLIPAHSMLSLSRRNLDSPFYRITRSSRWKEKINPWKEPHRLPLLNGGLLGRLLYAGEPQIIDDLDVNADDPACEYITGQRSLVALPIFEHDVASNMVVLMREEPAGFSRESLPELVWTTSLFGRATLTLVLAEELRQAYELVDHELKAVEDIQRSLLPNELPHIPTMDLAVHYQTSRRAGGDYYDFFPLPDGKWGILIADASGHGTPAAVIMAITHSIAHTHPGPPIPPSRMLNYVNHQLTQRYTGKFGTFVTAFYGIYDPAKRELTYASAGHNPPRVKDCQGGRVLSLDGARGLPLGIALGESHEESRHVFRSGDQIIFYTDGITEAQNAAGEFFGVERLDATLEKCLAGADDLTQAILQAVYNFTGDRPPDDDRTLLIAKIQ